MSDRATEATRNETLRAKDRPAPVLARAEPLFTLPPRPRRPLAVCRGPGQRVCWQLNYGFSGAAGAPDWSYGLATFDVAYGPVDPDVFPSEPTVLVDECGPVRQRMARAPEPGGRPAADPLA